MLVKQLKGSLPRLGLVGTMHGSERMNERGGYTGLEAELMVRTKSWHPLGQHNGKTYALLYNQQVVDKLITIPTYTVGVMAGDEAMVTVLYRTFDMPSEIRRAAFDQAAEEQAKQKYLLLKQRLADKYEVMVIIYYEQAGSDLRFGEHKAILCSIPLARTPADHYKDAVRAIPYREFARLILDHTVWRRLHVVRVSFRSLLDGSGVYAEMHLEELRDMYDLPLLLL